MRAQTNPTPGETGWVLWQGPPKKKKKNTRWNLHLPTSFSLSPSGHASGKRKDAKKKMASEEQVKASHILLKHEGSRRKASWKDPDGRIISATTRDAAVRQLRALREDILAGKARFEDVAARYSDCSSAKRGGDLGQPLPHPIRWSDARVRVFLIVGTRLLHPMICISLMRLSLL